MMMNDGFHVVIKIMIWGFPESWGYPQKWMVYFMENPFYKWMITRGTPISGHIEKSSVNIVPIGIATHNRLQAEDGALFKMKG